MSATVPSYPVPPDDVVGNIFGWFDGIVTGCIPVPSYAVECVSSFDSMIDNSVHGQFVCVISI